MYKGFKKLKLMTIALALRPILIILLDLVITFSSGHPDVNILAVLLRHVLALLVLNLPATLLRLLPAPVNTTLQVTVDTMRKSINVEILNTWASPLPSTAPPAQSSTSPGAPASSSAQAQSSNPPLKKVPT